MEYSVTVGCNWSTNDMGIANHGSYDKNVPVENIVPGYNLFEQLSTDRNAEVVSFEDGVLAFKFLGETITVKPGHIWSSPMYHVYNPYISESEGFYVGVSKVGAEKEKDEKKNSKRIVALVKEMREIAKEENYPVWKNIPLARELAELLQGSFPVSGKYLSASETTTPTRLPLCAVGSASSTCSRCSHPAARARASPRTSPCPFPP